MDRTTKDSEIVRIKEKFSKMSSAVFLDYKGLNVAQVTKLRDEFRKSGVEYRVVKNTLVKHALKEYAWSKNLAKTLTGMTGVAWSYEEPGAAAKVVKAFRKEKENEKLGVKAGLVDGALIPGERVETDLASMPGKNELRATLLATLQAPMQKLLQQLNAPAQNFVYVLKAKEDKAEKAG
ncbi:MAG: 50S ribosomal protein L10 [Polyangiaceae bacterium]|nr:50S ribosomal protein L10 [Polyangiaceae bacterium]